MENFVHDRGLTTFDEMAKLKADTKQEYDAIVTKREKVGSQIDYLESLLKAYKEYEPYIKNHKEQWALKGFARKKYERSHIAELSYYDVYCEKLKGMIREPDKKITPKAWKTLKKIIARVVALRPP